MKDLFNQNLGTPHEHERAKSHMFLGDERNVKIETHSRAVVMSVLSKHYPCWIFGNDLVELTKIPSSERRARELRKDGLIESRRKGRRVQYRVIRRRV